MFTVAGSKKECLPNFVSVCVLYGVVLVMDIKRLGQVMVKRCTRLRLGSKFCMFALMPSILLLKEKLIQLGAVDVYR